MSLSTPTSEPANLPVAIQQSPVITGLSFESLLDLIVLLRKEYGAADGIVQKVQRFVSKAGTPAINELRYAGHHLLIALGPTPKDEDSTSELRRAINHCKRASYDASEAGILFAFDRIDVFKADYKDVIITDVISDWPDILSRCNHIRDALAVARGKGEDRFQDHAETAVAFDELVAVCRKLDAARNELNKKLAIDRRDARRFVIGTLIAVVFGIAGLVVTVLAS